MHSIIKTTYDGSHTLFVPDLDEHYHSTHGAIQESMHVFINAGLNYFNNSKELTILEIGLGTGLNAFLTYIESKKKGTPINYTGIEAYPLTKEIIENLNYPEQLNEMDNKAVFKLLHECNWNKEVNITDSFLLTKLNVLLQDYKVKKQYDLIYFDAFGPGVQEEMWTREVFEKMYQSLAVGGILVTYCAKGEVKRTLKSVGFEVENIPGPPGKREMTRARKC